MAFPERTLTKTEVVTVYARAARFYDLWGRLTETRARRRALELARVRDGESVLEVAVGTGLAFADLFPPQPERQERGHRPDRGDARPGAREGRALLGQQLAPACRRRL